MSRENHAEHEIRKLAAELYQRAATETDEFELEELVQELLDDLNRRYTDGGDNVIADLVEIIAREAIAAVDKTNTRPTEQPTLSADLDSVVKVGDGRRRARRYMDNQNWVTHLGYIADNAARVNERAARENRRYAALAPYLAQGMNTEAALAAWMADHPEQELS